jgi:DNA-binding transcriptional LysR family regulator
MARLVLFFAGPNEKPLRDVNQIRNMVGVRLLDETSRTLYVEATARGRAALEQMQGWLVQEDQQTPNPKPRRKTTRTTPLKQSQPAHLSKKAI